MILIRVFDVVQRAESRAIHDPSPCGLKFSRWETSDLGMHAFREAFVCKVGTPMAPATIYRVW